MSWHAEVSATQWIEYSMYRQGYLSAGPDKSIKTGFRAKDCQLDSSDEMLIYFIVYNRVVWWEKPRLQGHILLSPTRSVTKNCTHVWERRCGPPFAAESTRCLWVRAVWDFILKPFQCKEDIPLQSVRLQKPESLKISINNCKTQNSHGNCTKLDVPPKIGIPIGAHSSSQHHCKALLKGLKGKTNNCQPKEAEPLLQWFEKRESWKSET